jgi:hemolysin activation/secretion protein
MLEPGRNSLDIFGDNEGVDSTGMYEGGALFHRHSTFFSDDRFTAYGTGALGSFNGNFSYNLPIDAWGDRIGLSYQRNHINIIQGPFQNLKIAGWGQTAEVDFTHPVIATQQWLLTANLSAADSMSKTDQGGFFVAKTTTAKATAGFSVTNSTADHTITVSPSVSMARSRNGILDQSRYVREVGGTGRAFFDVGHDFSLVGLFGAQYSPQRLLPADQLFQVGGATTVRGYPVDALAGDSGYYVNGELHRSLDQFVHGLDTFIFYDWGSVCAVAPTVKSLEAIGYGWDYEFGNLASFQFAQAFPLKNQVPSQGDFVIYARVVWHVF